MRSDALFAGVCTALVTPFRQGEVDFDALRGLIDRQARLGVPALLVGGTTGEASTLSDAEWEQVLACAVEAAGQRTMVIAGTGTNDLARTLRRARLAGDLGAQAQLVVTPYYNKTTQAGLIDYYTRVADGSGLPLILYNVPGRTGLNLLPETAAALAKHPQIAGIKEASGSLNQIAELTRLCDLPVYCGSDELMAPALRLGAKGAISVVSNLLPARVTALCGAAYAEASRMQRELQPLIAALFSETNPAPVKAALALMGQCSSEVRSPLVSVTSATLARLRDLLAREECLCGGC